MNLIKRIALTAFGTVAAFSAVLYSSCSGLDSKCQSIICLNGGSCSHGSCICPSGYEGANCQLAWSQKFVGSWNWKQHTTFQPIEIAANELHPTLLAIQWFPIGPYKNLLCTITSTNQFIIQPNQGDTLQGKILEGSGTMDSLGYKITGSVKWQYKISAWPQDSLVTEIVPLEMDKL